MTLDHHPGPAADPFWDAVRRRHPDLDPVLLPPAPRRGPRPGDAGLGVALSDAEVAAERQQVALLLRALCAHLDPEVVPPEPTLRPGPTPLTLEVAVTVVLREHPDGHRSLARLAEALTGWQRRLAPGRVARLEARLGGRAVAASYVDDERVLVLTATSAPLPVTREQSRRLRGVAS